MPDELSLSGSQLFRTITRTFRNSTPHTAQFVDFLIQNNNIKNICYHKNIQTQTNFYVGVSNIVLLPAHGVQLAQTVCIMYLYYVYYVLYIMCIMYFLCVLYHYSTKVHQAWESKQQKFNEVIQPLVGEFNQIPQIPNFIQANLFLSPQGK